MARELGHRAKVRLMGGRAGQGGEGLSEEQDSEDGHGDLHDAGLQSGLECWPRRDGAGGLEAAAPLWGLRLLLSL